MTFSEMFFCDAMHCSAKNAFPTCVPSVVSKVRYNIIILKGR